jgi:PAS domain S-box-containing protein
MLLVALAVAPGAVLILHAASVQRAALVTDARQDLERAALLAAERLRGVIELAHGAIETFGDLAALRDSDGACVAAARQVLEHEPGVANVGAADVAGAVFCSAVPLPGPADISDRLYFQRAMRARDVVVGELTVDRIIGMSVLHVAHPAFDQAGRYRGVAFASLPVAHLDRILASVPLRQGEVLTVVDGRGRCLSSRPDPQSCSGSSPDAPIVRRMLAEREGYAEEAGVDGVRRMHAFMPIRAAGAPTDITVSVGVPRAIALASADRLFLRTLAFYGIAAALGLFAAWAVSEFTLVRRLRRLAAAAARLARGDLRARAGLDARSDDIGRLGAAFDDMASALEALTRENRLILESAPIGILGLTPSGQITSVNPAACSILGYATGELLGRDAKMLMAPDGPAPPTLLVKLSDVGHQPAAEGAFLRKDGTSVAVEAAATPLRDGDEILGAVVTFRDVSEQKLLEQQFRQAQKMEAVGRLAGGVAHDFNNVLTVILSAGEELVERLGHDREGREEAEEVVAAARRASEITRQLLAFSRKQLLSPAVLDPNEVVAGMRKLLARLLGDDVDLAISLAASGRVRVDPGQLEQVLVNLAVNARDAMPSGGKLTIDTADIELDGEHARGRLGAPAGPYVVIAVTDDGTGMDEGTLSRIFEPFFTTKEPGKGTGLGLSTVWGIVKQSGGDLHVYSSPGAGSTFKIYLPRIDDLPRTEQPPQRAAPANGTETVLLVEDSDPVRKAAARALGRGGYRVIEAAHPREALQRLEQSRGIDLLLSDVMMPECSGPELAERASELVPSLRVLFMSGYTGAALVHQRIVESGAAYIQKPFTGEALLLRVRAVLDGDGA